MIRLLNLSSYEVHESVFFVPEMKLRHEEKYNLQLKDVEKI